MSYVVGFDEVGRGSLAGPVTVGLVALPVEYPLLTAHISPDEHPADYSEFSFVRDSKNLNEKLRHCAVQKIFSYDFPALTLSASNELIDTYGISPCLRHLLLLGYATIIKTHSLSHSHSHSRPHQLLEVDTLFVDGRVYLPETINQDLIAKIEHENNLPPCDISVFNPKTVIHNEDKADDKYLCIALASCLAKVSRDTYMSEQAKIYPEYKWDTNKGYGTHIHREAIKNNRSNHLIRKTFIKNIPLV